MTKKAGSYLCPCRSKTEKIGPKYCARELYGVLTEQKMASRSINNNSLA